MKIQEMLEDYDWKEVFGFAGGKNACNSGVPERALPNDLDTSVDPFDMKDVEEICYSDPGERDGHDWIIVGKLKDKRYFAIVAGCDYTGWD